MPIANGIWTNWTFSNCHAAILGGNVVFTNTTIANVTGPGIFCTTVANIPWFMPAFIIVLYAIIFFLFSWTNSMKLFVTTAGLMFGFTTMLVSYGFVGGPIWMATFAVFVLSLVVMYLSNKY